jgi:polysaccharide export outer membrane protein
MRTASPAAFMSSLAAFLLFVTLCAVQFGFRAHAVDNDYHVGPGDLIRISVFGSPELALDARVSESGNITYPMIGQVPVTGLSAGQIEQTIAQRLISGQFLRSPQVSALVVEYQSQKISVLGQVTKPGQYPLTAATHVMDLLAQAGGTVQPMAADEATLVRSNGTKVPVDLTLLFQGDPTQNYTVAGGDTIFVPKAAQFYIYGEVQKPGMYRLERDMTVSRAISSGGGLTPRGSERHTVVKRRDASGKEKKISVKGSDAVQPDDVILVNESWF